MRVNFNLLLMAIVISLGVSVFSLEFVVFPGTILLIGIFIALLIRFMLPESDANFLTVLFIGAFLFRIISSLFLYNVVSLHGSSGLLGDGYGYTENGYKILQLWKEGMSLDRIAEVLAWRNASGNLGSYDFWNAFVYFFTGKSPITVIFINCLAGSLTAVFIYYITKQISNRRAAVIAAIMTAFWPSLFFWSIQNFKESLILIVISVLLWSFLRLKRNFRFHLLFMLIASSICLGHVRGFVLLVFYALVLPLSYLLIAWKRNRIGVSVASILFLLGLIGLISTTEICFFGKEYFPGAGPGTFLDWLYQMRTVRAFGAGSAFLSDWNFTTPLMFALFVPVSSLIVWLAPFPWQLGSFLQILAVPEQMIYYMFIPFIFFGIRFILRYRINEGGLILTYVFIMSLVLVFIEGNIGTLFRHRAMILPFNFIFAAIGMAGVKLTFRYKARNYEI